MSRFSIALLTLAFFSFLGYGQEIRLEKEERRKMEFAGVFKSSVSLELGGKSGYAGVSYDLLLTEKWRLGLGVGYPGAGLDVKCFPFSVRRDKLVFNLGLRSSVLLPQDGTNVFIHSTPIGVALFAPSRLNLELDFGPALIHSIDPAQEITGTSENLSYFWGSIKIGYRFSFYAMKRARRLNKEEE